MTMQAIDALKSEQRNALSLMASLTADEWQAPSGCSGWRVQDVFCHMASVFHSIADPASIESGTSADVEANAEVPVRSRASWSTDQVVAEYEEWSDKGIGALSFMNSPEMADTVIPLANLGSHPMHILANAIVFDHYCHLRHDVGHAISRAANLPRDPDALSATAEWMLAGLPQMCAEALTRAPRVGLNLVFEGPAASSWIISPGDPQWSVTPGVDAALVSAVSTVHDFVSWGTKRAPWSRSVRWEGDSSQASAVLDAINII